MLPSIVAMSVPTATAGVETFSRDGVKAKITGEGATRAVRLARTRAVASTGSPGEQARDENVLVQALRQLFALREGYPQLKANQNFLSLQSQLAETEDRLQAARRLYNGNVREYNNRCEMFPTNVLAGLFHFERAEFFEIESAIERQALTVNFGGPQ